MCTHTRDTGPRQSLRNSAFRTGAVAGAGDVDHRRDKMIAHGLLYTRHLRCFVSSR